MPSTAADHDAGVDAGLGADADRDDRLAEGDDDDQPVALGEVAGHELPALGAEDVRPAHVEHQGERPERALRQAVERTDAATSRPTPIAC